MRIITVVFLFLVFLNGFLVASLLDGILAFEDFKITYSKRPVHKDPVPVCSRGDKSCPNPVIESNLKSLLYFVNTYQLVESHNELFEKGELSYDLTINKFADLSLRDIARFSEGLRTPENGDYNFAARSDSNILTITQNDNEFPAGPSSIDWRALGHVTGVKDQGYICNSCWAFSTIATLESAFSIATGKLKTLSEQYLIDCNRHDKTGNWGCKGGNPRSAFSNIKYSGIPSDEAYPYKEIRLHANDYPCTYNISTSVGNIKGFATVTNSNETFIRDIVAKVGPVAAAINSRLKTFVAYKSGVYDDPECTAGGSHSVAIVGYGTARYKSGKTADYWLCKNSWSDEWGRKDTFGLLVAKTCVG